MKGKYVTLPTLDRVRHIIKLATPIIFGMLSINIIGLVDTAMIGILGDKSLAAVGFGSFLFWCMLSIFAGIGSATQTLTARELGSKNHHTLANPLVRSLWFATPLAGALTLICFIFTEEIMTIFSNESDTIEIGIEYFQLRIVGLIAVGWNVCFRGFWNGIKQPGTYLKILILTHATNICLNWLLIYGNLGFPELNAAGAGLASSLSLIFGMITFSIITYKNYKKQGFNSQIPSLKSIKEIVRLGTPLSLEQLLFSTSHTCFMAIIGNMGTQQAAIANVVINIVLFLWLPGLAFGMTSITLVSEALGKKETKDAENWAWDIIKCAAILLIGVSGLIFIFPEHVLGWFIRTPDTLTKAIFPLRIDCISLWFSIIGLILMQSLIGAQKSTLIMKITICFEWGLFVPTMFVLQQMGYGLNILWIFSAIISSFKTIYLIVIWKEGNWKH